MINFYFFVLLAISVTLLPVGIGVVAVVKFWNREAPPLWLAFLLISMAIGSAVVLVCLPQVPILLSLLLVSGSLVFGVIGSAFILRRTKYFSFSSALITSIFVALPFAFWVDFRFRVIVLDSDGRPVDVRAGDICLHHPPKSYFQSYQYAKGVRLQKGTTYIGIVRWLQFKDQWTFPGALADIDSGGLLTDLKWEHARWSEWPKRVTTDRLKIK